MVGQGLGPGRRRGGAVLVMTLCLFFGLLFPQRLRTLLSSCELFSVSICFFITTMCPTLLSCFCSFLSPLLLLILLLLFPLPLCPPPPLSHHPSLPPPYRMCVCHVFHQSYGTECNQSHAPVSDYGGTVLLPFLHLSQSL